MKARQIRKIREKINTLKEFQIRETASLFGDFFGHNRIGLVMSNTKVLAGDPVRAIEIYMKRYWNKFKQKNEYERSDYSETTEKWGRLMVTDSKGFRRFYK